jgi:hypothetical protein
MGRDGATGPEDIHSLTARYEAWLRTQAPVVEEDLGAKHEAMRESPFVFLRATYYAWATWWPDALPAAFDAPVVTAVGDLHLENFGTWRDAEGRLAWGINDFDEASPLPYTNDLVRLAASAALAYRTSKLRAPGDELAAALMEGYVDCLREGGRPILFAENSRRLGRRVLSDLIRPGSFWKKKVGDGGDEGTARGAGAEIATRALPAGTTEVTVRPRVAGVGSLGRPRFLAVGRWDGARVAREAKALVGSAAVWATGAAPAGEGALRQLLERSCRSRDPFLTVSGGWVVRRLAPDTDKIAITSLGRALELKLATLMGREVANVHLATPGAAGEILRDLAGRKPGWLRKAARGMADLTRTGHAAWKCKTGR